MDCSELFKGKRITVMGLGVLGRGVGDVAFLAECGAQVRVTDKKSEAELAPSVEALKKYPNISFKLGGHDTRDFQSCDLVIKAAGVPIDSPEIAAARSANVPVVMSTALFAKYARQAGATIVGVTGTRGKSTISHMIAHILKAAGKKVVLGGNIRGVSTLATLPSIEKGDIAVLELDSWQLQGFAELKLSPHIAVFSNLLPDHQNYYKDMEEYFADKANVFRFQKEGDFLFVGESVKKRIEAMKPHVAPKVPPAIPAEWKLSVVGEHNRENGSLAVAAARVLQVGEQDIRTALASFEGVEGRLQFVRDVNGVRIYNDNNATTPEATIAGIRALGDNVTLIIGGSEKGSQLEELVAVIKANVANVIVLTHDKYKGSQRLVEVLKREGLPFLGADTLDHALKNALAVANGGSVLFSPAFASFGMFKNEYERSDQFLTLVRAL